MTIINVQHRFVVVQHLRIVNQLYLLTFAFGNPSIHRKLHLHGDSYAWNLPNFYDNRTKATIFVKKNINSNDQCLFKLSRNKIKSGRRIKPGLIAPILPLSYHENIMRLASSQTRERSIVIREIASTGSPCLSGVRDELNYSC